MIIACPHCGFSREVAASRLPADAARATCPRCRSSFSLNGSMTEAPLPTDLEGAPQGDPAALPKAGFWIRLVAFLIDSLLLTTAQVALGYGLQAAVRLIGGPPNEEREIVIMVVTWLAASILGMLYYVLFTGYCGQTPGKMAVRVKVILTSGADITYSRAFLRETLGKFLSGILFGAGYIMIAFSAQKQGLHDRIADTFVIKL